MERKILRLLFVDDSPDEVENVVIALRDHYLLKWQRVQDLTTLEGTLAKSEWDVVASEYQLPQLKAAMVLESLKRANLDVPLLVLTRTIRDAELIGIMRAGARDVVRKDRSMRLLPVIERELAGTHERAAYRHSQQTLKEIEHKHDAYIDGAREAISYCQDGMHLNANRAYLDMFEYDNLADIEGVPLMNLIDKTDHQRFRDYIRQTRAQKGAMQEFLARRKSGTQFPVEIMLAPIRIRGEPFTQVLVSDISKRRAVENKLKYLSEHDPLTGLYNRHYFLQELTRAVARVKSLNASAGLVYIDVEDLRRVNKTLGHTSADRFLIIAARALREIFGESAVVARCADREFTALVHDADATALKALAARAGRVFTTAGLQELNDTVQYSCRTATVAINRHTESVEQVIAELYRAVEPAPAAASASASTNKQNDAALATKKPAATTPAAPTKKAIAALSKDAGSTKPEDRLQWAIQREAFQLNYQPMINLHGDPAEYFEVLVRMMGDDGQLIPAAQFMPQAEQSGHSTAIDRWVVRQAIRSLADLHRQNRRATFFVNLSAVALHDVEMVVLIQRWLNECTVRGRHVILELDEAGVLAHVEAANAFMRAAKLVGCALCLDNFGRHFGAIAQLSQLPIDYFKLDGSLVQNLADDANRQSLKAAVDAAKTTGRKIVAKSVESANAISVLWSLGVDYAQGNYFQQADVSLDYEFVGETTLLSAGNSPSWTTTAHSRPRG